MKWRVRAWIYRIVILRILKIRSRLFLCRLTPDERQRYDWWQGNGAGGPAPSRAAMVRFVKTGTSATGAVAEALEDE